MDPNKASGPDNISNLLLKEVASEVCTPLCKIFNLSLIAGLYPNYWKSSHVIPIHKKDDPKNKSNYRPISLLCNISKIFERLVHHHQKLYSFLQHNTLLSSNNSGFHSGDSTINQLTCITHNIYKAIDRGKDIRVVFLDMSKAFDKVWYKDIVHKLKCKGVIGSLLR